MMRFQRREEAAEAAAKTRLRGNNRDEVDDIPNRNSRSMNKRTS